MKSKINLRKYLDSINKDYPNRGHEPAVSLGVPKRRFIKSGISEIDAITGGGYPKGKLTLISGLHNSGKTYVALHAAAAANKRGGYVAWLDNDRTFDKARALDCGIDPDRFYLVHARDTVESLDIALALARSGMFELIIFDTLTSLVPKRDTPADFMEPIFYDTLNNKYYEESFERFFAIVSALNQTVIATTISYKNPNVLYGNPETLEGGRSLKFYAGLWLDLIDPLIVKRAPVKDVLAFSTVDESFSVSGLYIEAKCKKNKYAPPFMVCHFLISFSKKRNARPYIRPKTNKKGIATECRHYKPYGYKPLVICGCCDDSLSGFFGSTCLRCPFYSDDEHENVNINADESCFDSDYIF